MKMIIPKENCLLLEESSTVLFRHLFNFFPLNMMQIFIKIIQQISRIFRYIVE